MAEIDTRVERLEEYTEEAEAIKDKIQEVAENKNIEIESGVDTPLSLLNKIDLGTGLYDVEVTDNGDGTQSLNIIDAGAPPAPANVIYGVKIDLTDSNPETSVTYTDDAVGFNKSYMDFANTTFEYGSWADKFPFNQVKPCLFKNGAVVTYLNPDNYAQDTEGNAVDTTGADGDVMIEIPKVYYKLSRDQNYQYIQISNASFDGACCLAHTYKGVEKDKVYIGAYQACIQSNKARSISAVSGSGDISVNSWRTYAQANGTGYEQFYWNLLVLLQCLFVIQFKNLDSQSALGYGWCNKTNDATAGVLNDKGLYYGTATNGRMKFLGIEDFWGVRLTYIDGAYVNGTDLTVADVTSNSMSYNGNGTNYITAASGLTTGSGYTTDIVGNNLGGFFPKVFNGSTTTYYCNTGYVNSYSSIYIGGSRSSTTSAGVFLLYSRYGTDATSTMRCGRLTFCG